MSNKVFHFSNTGISSGQRFYLKDDVSGIFVRNLKIDSNFPVVASNLVYNTGNQVISGVKTFASRPNVNGTGVLLSGEAINFTLPNTIVYTTGVQNIDGIKSFISNTFFDKDVTITGNLRSSGTAFFNNNLNVVNTLNVSGDLNVGGNFNNPTLVLTRGDQLISGNKTFAANTIFEKDATIGQNLRVSGSSTFITNINVSGNLTVGGNITNPNLVLTRNKQTISGEKTFADNMSINAYTGNGYDTSNLDFKLNIGGNINENVGIQIDAYGTNPPQILMRRARGIPTGLSGVLKDDVLFNLQARGYVSGLNAYSTNSRAAIRLIAAEDWVGGGGYNGQGTYILFRSTNIGDSTAKDKVIIGSSGINVLNGNIYISGNAVLTGTIPTAQIISNVVYTTGDQTISGIKNFTNNLVLQDNILFSSQPSGYLTGIGYSGNYDGGYFLGRTKLSQNTSRLVDSSFGNTWTAKESSRLWRGISISSDGKYQSTFVYGGQIYVSSDYGNTWAAKESSRNWYSISISSDGKYQSTIVLDGQIYISSDYGNTWTAKESSRSWVSISISSDGKYQSAVVAYSGQIYVSSDYGNTWVAKESSRNWQGIAISSDGKYQSATVNNGQIYVSSDYGNTWVAKESSRNWGDISISSDGKYQTALVRNNGRIYVSSDYGNTWAAKESSRLWYTISISSDGKYQSAVVYGGQIYVSSDYGNTWAAKESSRTWYSISISSDGKYQTAVVYGGQIYISKTDEQIDGNLYVDNLYANNLVYNTGDQTISGVKTFANNVNVSGTGNFNAVKVSSIDKLFLSGIDIVITGNSSINVYNQIYINGNPVVTGSVQLGSYATSANLALTGSILDSKINSLSGYIDAKSIVLPTTLVYTTGDQTISGVKTFASPIYFSSGINTYGEFVNTSGGYIDLRGGGGGRGGNIISRGLLDTAGNGNSSNGGSIDLSAGPGDSSPGGSIISIGGVDDGSPGGTLNMSDSGGNITTSNDGGSIDTSNGGGSINTSQGGSINTQGGDSGGGSINTSGGDEDGGSINTSNGGGSIDLSGNTNGDNPAFGGSILASAGAGYESWDGGSGGTLDMRGEGGSEEGAGSNGRSGGSINTSIGGGSIDTRGQGQIQFGIDGTRTTLSGTATTNRTIYLPDLNGTLLTTEANFVKNMVYTTGSQIISGSKTFVSPIVFSSGANDGIQFGGAGGSIDLRGGIAQDGSDGSKGGSIIMVGGIANNAPNGAGNINTSAFGESEGGDILTYGGGNEGNHGGSIITIGGGSAGGDIDTRGNDFHGGSIYTYGGDNGPGGSIYTHGGDLGEGGSINTSNGGGSINLTGKGFIEFGTSIGVLQTRTTLSGTASTNITIRLPNDNGTLALDSNVVYTTGNQTISGRKTFLDSGVFSNEAVPAVPLLNNPLSIVGSGNNYLQLNIQNRATGTNATADLVITANNGTDNANYINLGINNSGYNDPAFSNGSGLDGYLFVNGGSLDIGTQTPNTAVEFHIGGTTANRAIARIDSSGINILSGTYRVNDIPSNTFTITLTHSSATPGVGLNYFGMNDVGYSSASLGIRRRIPIAETCQIRKASWSHLVGTTGSPNNLLSTGYVINTSSTPPQIGIVSTLISSISETIPAHYITNFSPPINVTSGDLIVAALGISGFTIAPLAIRDTVILYCYN